MSWKPSWAEYSASILGSYFTATQLDIFISIFVRDAWLSEPVCTYGSSQRAFGTAFMQQFRGKLGLEGFNEHGKRYKPALRLLKPAGGVRIEFGSVLDVAEALLVKSSM